MSQYAYETIIKPQRNFRAVDWREIWLYRELLFILIWRDIKVRYKQTALGAAWAVFQPFTSMIIFTVFFGNLAKIPSDNLPYPIFVYAGLLPWTFFSNSLTGASNSLVGQSHLISKVYFPRLLIPISSLGARLMDLTMALIIMFGMMVYYGIYPGPSILMFPFLIVATFLAALGAGTFLSALCVGYRDVNYITPFMIQLWMYATPVIYPASMVPERWRWVLSLNPMAGIIDAYRAALLGKPFDWGSLSISLAVSLVALMVGLTYFRAVERKFADII